MEHGKTLSEARAYTDKLFQKNFFFPKENI